MEEGSLDLEQVCHEVLSGGSGGIDTWTDDVVLRDQDAGLVQDDKPV